MYKILENELARVKKTKKQLCIEINMPYTTFMDKLARRTPITLDESQRIKDMIPSELPIELLFKYEESSKPQQTRL